MTSDRTADRFFLSTLVLFMLYALVSVIAGLKFLPGDLTQSSLPFQQVSAFAAALLDLVVVGGLLGGGIYVTFRSEPPQTSRLLQVAGLLWTLLALVTLAAGVLNLLIAGSALLAVLKVIVIALVVIGVARHVHTWTPIPLVWSAGMALGAVSTLSGLIPIDDFRMAAVVHTLASGVNTYIASVLAAAALSFWLLVRSRNASTLSADRSLNTGAGLLALAGALVTLSGLELNISWLSGFSALIIPLLYLIFVALTYCAFSERRPSHPQAAHWTVLGGLLLLGVGLLGGIQAAIHPWTAGTRLSDLQPTLALLAIVAIILGMIRHAAVEARSPKPTLLALAPFWLVTFGSLGGGLALAGAGLVQVYLERILSMGYLDTQALIVPLYAFWILGLVLLALGVMLYTLVFGLRRPRPQ